MTLVYLFRRIDVQTLGMRVFSLLRVEGLISFDYKLREEGVGFISCLRIKAYFSALQGLSYRLVANIAQEW